MASETAFVSTEVATIWHYLRRTIERLSDVAADVSVQELHWDPPAPETNSIAVLLVHTMANIEENVLAVVAGEPMNRDRDAEFVENDLTGAELVERLAALTGRLETFLAGLEDDRLDVVLNHPRRGEISARSILLQATTHGREHLGQVELTRDLARAAILGA